MKAFVAFCTVFLIVVLAAPCPAAPAGTITALQGRVDVLKAGRNVVAPVALGDPVDVGDAYRAKSGSLAEIRFHNGNVLKIGPGSKVEITQYAVDGEKSAGAVRVHRGRVQAIAGEDFLKKARSVIEGNKFEVETPNAVAGIRGTNMVVFYERGVGGALFLEGQGYIYNPAIPGQVMAVRAGYISFVMGRTLVPTFPRRATATEMKQEIHLVVHSKTFEATGAATGGETPQEFLVPVPTWRPPTAVDLPREIVTIIENNRTVQEKEQAPYLPPIEVASARLSGSLVEGGTNTYDYVNVYMDVSMFRPTTGGNFTVWKTNSIKGDYKWGDALNPATILDPDNYVVLSDGSVMEVNFQFTKWNGGQWESTVDGKLKGSANGTYTGVDTGDLTGFGSGQVAEALAQAAAKVRAAVAGLGREGNPATPAKVSRLTRIPDAKLLQTMLVRDVRGLQKIGGAKAVPY